MTNRIKKSFSSKLSLGIILLTVPIFIISLGILYSQSRHMILDEALGRANSVLNTTMQRLNRHLITIETATNVNRWVIEHSFYPDSLLVYSHRIVRLNPHIDGCSISAEPNQFPKYGKQFSVYTVREPDTIVTVIEKPYDYFHKTWYKTPHDLNAPCWTVYTDEADTLEVTLDGMIASYVSPLHSADSSIIGVISTDLSLKRLSKVISEEKPYPNSYFVMIDEEGRYFIHPDSTRLFKQSIFSIADPQQDADLIALGHEMTKGKQGQMVVTGNDLNYYVSFMPVRGTSWSLALVCSDSDILAGFHRLTYIVVTLLVIGLIVIMLLCHRAVSHTIFPLNGLLNKTQSIAAGNMEVHIPYSQREDAVGRLQNSFAKMLQSLNFHMGSVRYTSDQARQRNEELAQATALAKEADAQKTIFIQNVSHQIRTPLNILMGFAQVMSDVNNSSISEEEMKTITDMMDHNAKHLSRMVLMLYDSSETGQSEEMNSQQQDMVLCNDIAREAIRFTYTHYPKLSIDLHTELSDDITVRTNHLYLMRALRELLYNSAKYSDGKNIKLIITHRGDMLRYIVEDTGKGISNLDKDIIFKFFAKADDLSEGLGLGLPLAKRHAQNLGGDLFYDTDYHDGCRFIIEIPMEKNK